KVKLNLEPQTIIVHEQGVRQGHITAEQDDMGAGLGAQIGLHEDDDIQWLCELLMEQVHLIDTSLHVPFDRGLFEVFHGEGIIVDLVAILAVGSPPGVGTSVGEVERSITPQLRNEVQVGLSCHMERVVVAKVPIEDQVGQWDNPCYQVEQGGNHGVDP